MPRRPRYHRLFSCVWPGGVLVLALAAPLVADEPPTADVLARRVAELASDDFSTRQRATRELEAAGPDAIQHVAEAVKSIDAEVRSRALAILLTHALSGQTDRREQVRTALEALGTAPNSRTGFFAKRAIDRIHEITVSSAAMELTRLGATVMPIENSDPPKFNVQIRQTWSGGDHKLMLLTELGEMPWLSMENAPVTDASLPYVAKLTRLSKLYLGGSRIAGNSLTQLASLQQLQYLSLKQLPIDDAKIATLPTFPQLHELGLDGTQIGDEGLRELARYPQLQRLWLDETRVTDAGLVHLSALPGLRTLFLSGTKVAGAGLAELRHLAGLTYLSLKEVKLMPDSLKHVGQIEQLETLGLDHTNVTDDQLGDLAGLSQLRILWLSKTQISDAGIEHLKALRNLQVVYLHGSQVTAEAADDLRKTLPQCHVAR